MSGTTYFNSQSLDGIKDATLSGNLYANNIIMSSNMSTNSGQGNVYFSGNLVVNGNIFSLGGSVGSGSGTSQGVTYTLPSSYSLVSAGGTQPFANGVAAPNISGFNINLNQFAAQAVQAVTSFGTSTGMLKFATGGLYQVQCVLVGDQPVAKVGIGSTTSSTFPPTASPTGNYVYVYNFPLNSSPSEVVTIPLTITDTSKWYYLDAYFSNIAGTPTVLYQTAPPSGSAAGSNYGTYVQVSPFGNYLTSATGVASGLLMNCYGTTTLSSPVTSNTFRLAMTSSNGWTVAGVSTSLAVTSGGNFQVSQVGIYEVSMCLNAVGATPLLFGVGSLATDTAPVAQGPYLYQYAPMYTQDPTTVVTLPLNITDTSKYYYLDVIFPGTQATVTLSNVSTFVSLKPVGSYVSPSTNPWSQQGTSVYYQGGAVAIGGVTPSLLTETFTVNGNTSFVGNVSVVSDASGSTYVNARRVPAGSLSVANYVTGSVPLTTTTSLINNYLSNAASVVSTAPTYNPALSILGSSNSWVNLTPYHSSHVNTSTTNVFVEAWVYVTANATANNQFIYATSNVTNDELGLYINGTGQIVAFETNTGGSAVSAVAATNIITATWTHIALAWNQNTKTVYVFKNGTSAASGVLGGTAGYNATGQSVYIGNEPYAASRALQGYVYDMRVIAGSTVPITNFTAPATPAVFSSTTLPSYTGLTALTGNTIALALQSQYFPGASPSPYGPCLTLPGTVGSYYSAVNTAYDTNWKTNGFCLEAWVNFASFANAASGNGSWMIGHMNSGTGGNQDWSFGPKVTGELYFFYFTGSLQYVNTGVIMTTGQWSHICVQSNGTNIYIFLNGVLLNSGGTAIIGTPTITAGVPISIGQLSTLQGPNFAIAKARLVFGTTGTNGNVYSTGNFTPSPNFNPTLPSGGTVAWQLESQYPLPTYPSIQDVTPLALQSGSYGAVPTPVGGVTSNVLGPFSTLQSVRFDGTGYIDYGANASSALTTNLWATPWTIEAWVYLNNFSGASSTNTILGRNYQSGQVSYDWLFYVNNLGQLVWRYGNSVGVDTQVGGPTLSTSTWYHVAATYDGARTNVYCSINSSTVTSSAAVAASMGYNPAYSTQAGFWYNSYISGNLADVRVSNVARYTGSTYTVPNVADGSGPFVTDRNTLLLLKSLGGQVGTTLEVQGRGLNSTSIGAGRVVQSYPPAPMSSYLLDTTGNTFVTYGQGKYVASASSEYPGGNNLAWYAFDGNGGTNWAPANPSTVYVNGLYVGSVTTVDTLGTSYPGEWLQIQMPVSIILSSYTLINYIGYFVNNFSILGSRDGFNWTLVNRQIGMAAASPITISVQTTQAYSYFRFVAYGMVSTAVGADPNIYTWTLNGTEESLCVTSDSKVGVGIANPQRALEVAGDLVVSGTISGGAGLGGFRNRIINGDMRIAQRGTSALMSTAGGYTNLDRWGTYIGASPPTITTAQRLLTASDTPSQLGFSNSYSITVNSGSSSAPFTVVFYNIEGYNIADFRWGTSFGQPVTMSFWMRTNLPVNSVLSVAFRNIPSNYSYIAPVSTIGSNAWQYVTFTVPPPPNGSAWTTTNDTGIALAFFYYSTLLAQPNTWISGNYVTAPGSYNWVQTAGNYIEFTGVQLEKGTVATPFEVRPYATELFLCQTWNSVPSVTGSSNICLATTGGNVGIGITNPTATLQIGTTGVTGNVLQIGNFTLQMVSYQGLFGAGTVTYTPSGSGLFVAYYASDTLVFTSTVTAGGQYSATTTYMNAATLTGNGGLGQLSLNTAVNGVLTATFKGTGDYMRVFRMAF